MKWTQEQAIDFETARECVTALMAICTAKLVEVEANDGAVSERVHAIDAQIRSLFKERAALTPTDVQGVARVLAEYSPLVREGLAALRCGSKGLTA